MFSTGTEPKIQDDIIKSHSHDLIKYFIILLVELLTKHDTTKFYGHWPSNREVTQGEGERNPPSQALPASEKPSLFRVKEF